MPQIYFVPFIASLFTLKQNSFQNKGQVGKKTEFNYYYYY